MDNIININEKSKQTEKDNQDYIIEQIEKLLEVAKNGDIEELATIYIKKSNTNSPVVNVMPPVSLRLLGALELAQFLMKNEWSFKRNEK